MTKKIELTEGNQKISKKYLEELNKVFEAAKLYGKRQEEAQKKLIQLRQRLMQLESNFTFELDDKKRDAISQEKKEVLFELQETENLIKTDVAEIVRYRFDELKESKLYKDARQEAKDFSIMVDDEVEAVQKEAEDRVKELKNIKSKHIHNEVSKKIYHLQSIIRKDIGVTKLR